MIHNDILNGSLYLVPLDLNIVIKTIAIIVTSEQKMPDYHQIGHFLCLLSLQ